jgi:microcystin-dependent protein
MSDFSLPVSTTAYLTTLADLKDRDVDAITLCYVDPSNIPAQSIKYNRAGDKFQEYISSVWTDKVISIAGGGTGAASASAARTSLGLGTLAVQNNNAVAITGGTIAGASLVASDLASGLVPQARLGSGSDGSGNHFLADDQTYKTSVAIGTGAIWFTTSAPTGWLILNGQAVSRATYAALFGLWGTLYGVGDGSTTFNIPDLRGYFPFGRAASGTGSTFGVGFGSIDHVHTGPSHTHTYTDVVNHTHPITDPGHIHTSSIGNDDTGSGGGTAIGFGTVGVSGRSSLDRDGNTWVPIASAVTGITVNNPSGGVASGTTAAGGSGNTGSANPPGFVVNFIVKAL